jgi:beta-xylosidase
MISNDVKKGWVPDLGNGTYKNPIIFADYSDPDIVRVKDNFYLVSSSFSHMPGLPILHSKDLVNWEIVNHIFESFDQPGYDLVQHGKGVWAPSIRYHDGKFWVFFAAPDEGIFMCTARDPLGKWSAPHMVKQAKGWIDPCPFWDDDGQGYLIHAFAFSRCGIKHKLKLCRMATDGSTLLDEGQIILDGTEHHPTLEGPKMYKRNGYYYIFAPAGGVPTGWQTIFRSKSIYGPYEDKIVLHQGNTSINGPHQGGWVETESGDSWFVHFQDRGAYGRIVHLQPMYWENEWPVMGVNKDENGIGEPVLTHRKPKTMTRSAILVPETTDDFNQERLGLQWQWQANPKKTWYSLNENTGSIRLYAAPIPQGTSGTLFDAPNLLMQKFSAPTFEATTKCSVKILNEDERMGLMVFGEEYAFLSIYKTTQGLRLGQFIGKLSDQIRVEEEIVGIDLENQPVYLRVCVEAEAVCTFSYSINGTEFLLIGDKFQAQPGRWVGAKVGIFSSSAKPERLAGFADFEFFHVNS